MPLAAKLRDARIAMSNRRTIRRANRQLADELAGFATTAERDELEQILDRHPAEDAEPIRAILHKQDMERMVAAHRYHL
jgi:hypothetical protein